MPGLGRPQRLAHDQGGDEPDQARDYRPQGSDRQPEQPPRYPRQDRHQHDAGGQHDHREYDPVHTDTKLFRRAARGLLLHVVGEVCQR